MNYKKFLSLLSIIISMNVYPVEYNVSDFGAIADGKTLCTKAIQNAIDKCAGQGGGRIVIPAGNYYTGTVFLRSFVELHLEQNAQLIGSTNYDDYPDLAKDRKGLVHCVDITNAAITGFGTINANGSDSAFQLGDSHVLRPHVVIFNRCKKMNIQDVSLINSADWSFRILDCQEVFVRGLKIYSHSNFNNDGIDIDGKDIIVSDCNIEATDDGICLKSNQPLKLCENVSISNCIVASNCNALKFGTASLSGFKNISISNCIVKTPAENDLFGYKAHIIPGVSVPVYNNTGISIEMVDGGSLEKVTISNITMENVLTPVFIRLGQRRQSDVKYLKDIIISNIVANGVSHMSSSITGIPGHCIENVKISNVIINCNGGGLMDSLSKEVPEQIKMYPENKMFGVSLPAYGFYLRHVDNIVLENIQVNLQYKDQRHAFWLEDAHNVRLNGITAKDHTGSQALVRIVDGSNITLSGYDASNPITLFAKISGKQSNRIKLTGNDFSTVKRQYELEPGVNLKSIMSKYNF